MKPDIWHDPLFLAGLKGGGQGGSASGPIVTFTGDGSPLRSLRLAIDPVQDLHGYDSPWPAGGGKNRFNPAYWQLRENNGITATLDGEEVVLNGTATATAYINIARYTPGFTSDRTWTIFISNQQNAGVSIQLRYEAGGGSYTQAFDGTTQISGMFYDNTSEKEFAGYIVVTSGTQLTNFRIKGCHVAAEGDYNHFVPYSNLCPISGWDEANLWRTGKNLIDDSIDERGTTSVLLPVGTWYAQAFCITEPSNYNTRLLYYDDSTSDWVAINSMPFSNDAFSVSGFAFGYIPSGYRSATIEVSKPTQFKFYATIAAKETRHFSISYSEQTEWTPYSGNQYTLQLGQTVYGGTLDVLTGKLRVTHGQIASYSGETLPGAWISSMDVYSPGTAPTIGAQVVYELATPLTYPLSDITVQTLAGENVMWADCGDVAVEWAGGKGFGKEAMLAWVMNR